MKYHIKSLSLITILIIFFSLIFSFWLMFHTFSYQEGSFLIAGKVWSDFASQIPLIRSFSLGANFPVEYPLFPGEPIRYHFLFYALVGLLERLGMRIDFALNLPSALSFAALLMMIYVLAKSLFQSKVVGILSVIFFLFNGSLSFLEFFKTHPLSLHSLQDIISNNTFSSFGPYDGKVVSAFWNLNIYTNQRHLALSFAIVLGTIYLLFYQLPRRKNYLLLSLITGIFAAILLFINQAVFFINLLWIGLFAVLKPKTRFLPTIIILIIPLLLLPLSTSNHLPQDISFKLGYLMKEQPNATTFISYWFLNTGLYLFLIPLGFLFAPSHLRWFIIPLFILFVIPNTFQLSKDIINNHKFFNFFLIIGSMFVANLLVKLWQTRGKIICAILFCGLIFSGIIDFMAIANDTQINLPDLPINKTVQFIRQNTTPKSIFLNSTFIYNPISLAGRPIFLGYPYFLWSYGYEYDKREQTFLSIYRASTKIEACSLLQQNKISYVELNNHPEEYIKPNWDLWRNQFAPIFQDTTKNISIYDVHSSCR